MQRTELAALIEKAADEIGGQRELAQLLGVAPNRVTDWKTGVRECPPEKVALIADAAKLPADQWLARAVLWRQEGKPDAERLKKALGKCLRATTAVVALGCGVVVAEVARYSTMYRTVKWRPFLR